VVSLHHDFTPSHAHMLKLPPTTELFSLRALADRHPMLLSENRLRWAIRNRHFNGLATAGAVYESPVGEFILHEPSTLTWLLGLSGRAKPRRARKPIGSVARQCLPQRGRTRVRAQT
jgi:hypothetical protein